MRVPFSDVFEVSGGMWQPKVRVLLPNNSMFMPGVRLAPGTIPAIPAAAAGGELEIEQVQDGVVRVTGWHPPGA